MGFRILRVPIPAIATVATMLPQSVRIVGSLAATDGVVAFLLEGPWAARPADQPIPEAKLRIDHTKAFKLSVEIDDLSPIVKAPASSIIVPR